MLKRLISAVFAGMMTFQMSSGVFAHDNFDPDENCVERDIYVTSQSKSNLKFSDNANSDNMVSVSNCCFRVHWGYDKCERSEKTCVEDSKIKYKDVYKDVDLEYKISEKNLKEDLILNSKETQNEFEITYQIGGLKAFQQDDKTVELVNSSEKAVFKISAPEMVDDKNEKSDKLSLEIESENDGELRLKLVCDKDWLEDEERAYPVTVDPDYKDEDFEFNVDSSDTVCTNYRKKDTDTSVFLDLTGSDFKDVGVVNVSIYGRNSSGDEINCTNNTQYYILEAGKKYELYNMINENKCNAVQIRFNGYTGQRIKGLWSPDYDGSDSECLRIGDKDGTNGNITDRPINFTISPQGICWTAVRTKANSTSVYVNLEDCRGGTVDVAIFGVGGGSDSENCTYNADHYTLELGKKYELYNMVRENGHFAVQLRFTGVPGTTIIGRWSPDYRWEAGCITISGGSSSTSSTTLIRAISSVQKLINVPAISQLGEFPTGCESVSAVMVLKFYNYDISVCEFIDRYLEKKSVSEHPDPNSAFIGSPYTENSYGCFAPVIMKAMNKILKYDFAETRIGKSLAELSDEYVKHGIPVIIWVTMGMRPTRPTSTWTIGYTDENAKYKKGDSFTWPGNEHCVVLVGYNEQDYFVNDPLQPIGKVRGAYEKGLMEKRFREQGSQAVVVLKSMDQKANLPVPLLEQENKDEDNTSNPTEEIFYAVSDFGQGFIFRASEAIFRNPVHEWCDALFNVKRNPAAICIKDAKTYFIGRQAADLVEIGIGVGNAVNGLITIVGGITIEAGGVISTSTGVGAVAGIPMLVVSKAAVAAGAAEVGAGDAYAVSGFNHFNEDSQRVADTYKAPQGGGGITDRIKVGNEEVSFGHGGRHLEGTDLSIKDVNQAIADDVVTKNLNVGDFYKGQLNVGNTKIEYTSYRVNNTLINVGTYYPV